MIISAVRKQWPEDQDTPTFGEGSKEGGKLAAFVDRLANDERFTCKKYGLGHNAIKEMVLTHMRERRRAKKDAIICVDESAGESTISAEDSTSSNNTSPTPPYMIREGRSMSPISTQVSNDMGNHQIIILSVLLLVMTRWLGV